LGGGGALLVDVAFLVGDGVGLADGVGLGVGLAVTDGDGESDTMGAAGRNWASACPGPPRDDASATIPTMTATVPAPAATTIRLRVLKNGSAKTSPHFGRPTHSRSRLDDARPDHYLV
jgi:hypothetical protein